jgi:hypothetical protein
VKRLSLTCLVGILTVLAVPSQETWAQSQGPVGIPGADPRIIYNKPGGSTVPSLVPGIEVIGGGSTVPSQVPGIIYDPPEPWKPPQGWVDWVDEDLPDILTVWLKAVPDLIRSIYLRR